MNIILVGYGEMLRSIALGILNSGHKIVGVLRQETIKRNVFMRFLYDYIKPSDDYLFLKTHNLRDIKVPGVNSEEFRKTIKNLEADIIIVSSWSEKFSIQTLNTVPNGFINVHPSLLPKYRGPNPYLQVILHNEKMSGITFHLMDVNYDTGSILHQKEVPILKDDTGGSLKLRCCDVARGEIKFLLDNLPDRIAHQRSQNETEATYYSQISLNDVILNFQKESSVQIETRIRAFSPWIPCYLPIKNEFFTFSKYKLTDKIVKKPAGTIVNKTKNSISIVCKDFKIINFYDLKINRPFSKFISKIFWDKIINVNDKAI